MDVRRDNCLCRMLFTLSICFFDLRRQGFKGRKYTRVRQLRFGNGSLRRPSPRIVDLATALARYRGGTRLEEQALRLGSYASCLVSTMSITLPVVVFCKPWFTKVSLVICFCVFPLLCLCLCATGLHHGHHHIVFKDIPTFCFSFSVSSLVCR
ncbi:hypothetical protein CONLIGDRAFT_298617 [Coniochaeta ligniaria NRRL 30616]|uniref:Uncharacterized protein n=1 Tax=Coniochaeta ligniaria NRRL 30616 TaxID=1408157 RepID=A0A1J7IU78_9PEZI|nr:hypothetical protein CONLIGDRAFT_298617 [Coniochaeta ligniaria NRRL 30616]